MNMQQFMMGYLLARPLAEQKDRMMVALAASMFPGSSMMGPILLKSPIDSLSAREAEVSALQNQLNVESSFKDVPKASPDISRAAGPERMKFPPFEDLTFEHGPNVKVEYDKKSGELVITGVRNGADIEITLKSAGRKHLIKRTVVA